MPGGATGLNGIAPHPPLFGVLAFAALTIFTVSCLVNSKNGRGFLAVHDV